MFRTLIFDPLYNILILILDVVPWADLGLAIVILTILVKLALFPLSIKSVRTQQMMKKVEPEIKALQEKYKDDRQTQAMEMMALYKKYNIKPFSSFLVILIQLPIIFGLYYVFLRSGLPVVDMSIVYDFIKPPTEINHIFLGVIDITERSIWLSLLAAITQFLHARLTFKKNKEAQQESAGDDSFKATFAKTMGTQMQYVFPILVFFISYGLFSAIALYWATSNIFHIGQEYYVKRKFKQKEDNTVVA